MMICPRAMRKNTGHFLRNSFPLEKVPLGLACRVQLFPEVCAQGVVLRVSLNDQLEQVGIA